MTHLALPLMLSLGCVQHTPPTPAAAPADAPPPADTQQPASPPLPPWEQALNAALEVNDHATAQRILDEQLASGDHNGPTRMDLLWQRGFVHMEQGEVEAARADIRAMLALRDEGALGVPPEDYSEEIAGLFFIAELILLAGDAEQDVGIGADPSQAVVVRTPRDEYLFISLVRCGPDLTGAFENRMQSLIHGDDGHSYDLLSTACSDGDETRDFYFGIDAWMQHLEQMLGGPSDEDEG